MCVVWLKTVAHTLSHTRALTHTHSLALSLFINFISKWLTDDGHRGDVCRLIQSGFASYAIRCLSAGNDTTRRRAYNVSDRVVVYMFIFSCCCCVCNVMP
jgi:hypothetical protein